LIGRSHFDSQRISRTKTTSRTTAISRTKAISEAKIISDLLELVIPSVARNLVLRRRRAQQILRSARNEFLKSGALQDRAGCGKESYYDCFMPAMKISEERILQPAQAATIMRCQAICFCFTRAASS
jgi:hypothetical protein